MTQKTDHWLNVLFRNGNTFLGNEGVVVPTGTTGQRPPAPTAGLLRFNSSLNSIEGYDGTSWQPLTIPGGALTTIDALTDTPADKGGITGANRVLKVDNSGTTIDYSNDVLILPSGAVQILDPAYELLVADNILANGKYVDDAVAAIGTGPFVSRVTGGAMGAGINFEMGAAGQILADTGSAPNPSYSFLSDINTGLSLPIANNMVFSTNSVVRVSIADLTTDVLNTLDLNGNNVDQVGTIDANTYTASGSNAQFVLPSYSKAGLPTGSIGGMIYVTDDIGGAVPAFYDGANWLRVTDRAIVS